MLFFYSERARIRLHIFSQMNKKSRPEGPTFERANGLEFVCTYLPTTARQAHSSS